jgi:uncharacterized protein YjeT (DUF2065 family)
MTPSSAKFGGWFLVVVGIIYILKPDIFRRGIWKKTSIAQRKLSPEGYLRYMRWVGVITLALGVVFLVLGYARS